MFCLSDYKRLETLLEIDAVVVVNFDVDRFGQIQAENAHDRFGIDNIAAGRQIDIVGKIVDDPNEFFDIIDRFEMDGKFTHREHSFSER